jgi:glycoside/pentoside/hexuronide:cation symporter, GPH family
MNLSKNGADVPIQYPDKRMPGVVYFGWGLGTLGITSFAVGSFLLLRFMTDFMAVPPAIAGGIFAAAKLYDGLVDPLAGRITDRTQSRWGRRRPYLLAGAFACGLIFMLAFNAPIVESRGVATAMLACLLVLHATAYTTFSVPYMAMPAEITDDPHERSKLMSFRVVNGALGNLVGGFGTASLIAFFGGGLVGHRLMGITVGLFIFAVLFTSFMLTSRAQSRDEGKVAAVSYRALFQAAAANRPFMILQASKLMLLSAAGFHTASAAFFVQRSLQLSDVWLGAIFATLTIGTVISQPLWLYMVRTQGKRLTYCVAGVFTAVTWLLWFPLGPGTAGWMVIALGTLAGIGNGGIVMVSQSMLPDTIEYQYRTTGMRAAGSFAGLYVMIEKFGIAIGSSLVGVTLGLFGYVESTANVVVEQPASAVLGISLSYSVLSTIFLLASVAIMWRYPLDERTMTLRKNPSSARVPVQQLKKELP